MTSAADPKDRRYLILGFPRSGTTLLSQLLDAHPDISCPPETNLFSAAGRFFAEQTAVEGPPIGVLAGLGFLGIEPQEVYGPMRKMLFSLHERLADGASCWVEKTATDSFYIDILEPMLVGHTRFIILLRHPLDVIASNRDLAETMGTTLPELAEAARNPVSPFDGYAHAWVEVTRALLEFSERHPEDCHTLRYEDLLAEPEPRLDALLAFMKVPTSADNCIAEAFRKPGPIGLGDYRVHETDGIRPPVKDGWRQRLPPAAAARAADIVGPLMEELGYRKPTLPQPPDREEAIRQYILAATMKRSRRNE
jgi:protein-tyrosine sulfotransferase